MMNSTFKRTVAAGSIALTAVAFAASAQAAPMMSGQSQLSAHAPQQTTDVRWRRGSGAALGIGLATGALVGAAIASSNRGYYYGEPYAYYDPAPTYYYGPAYGAGPAYYDTYAYDTPTYYAPRHHRRSVNPNHQPNIDR